MSGQSIVIRAGRIAEVRQGFVPASQYADGNAKVDVLDLRDKFVLPGLIDAHVHLTVNIDNFSDSDTLMFAMRTDADWAFGAIPNARITLESGFTTVRDLGEPEPIKIIFSLRKAIDAGQVIGPRIVAAGSAVTPSGSEADWLPFRPEIRRAFIAGSARCNGADECRAAAREQLRRGADVLKVYVTGSGLDDTETMFDDELRAVVEVAHRMGKKVAAHVGGEKGLRQALRLGVDSIEHGFGYRSDMARQMLKSGAVLVPTVAVNSALLSDSQPEAMQREIRKMIETVDAQTRAAHQQGVTIAFGSDAGQMRHGRNWEEFLALQRVGLTPMETITAATVNAAKLLDRWGDIGSIEVGKWADIVATDKSPLSDLTEFSRVSFVMKGGKVYKFDRGGAERNGTQ